MRRYSRRCIVNDMLFVSNRNSAPICGDASVVMSLQVLKLSALGINRPLSGMRAGPEPDGNTSCQRIS